jgi:hypothetical protein
VFQNNPEGGLLIFARMWRFVRIFHGFIETNKSEAAGHLTKAVEGMEYELMGVCARPCLLVV